MGVVLQRAGDRAGNRRGVRRGLVTDKQLEILHDHYKETFSRILQVEKSRNRLFLWMIGLFALLALEVAYPAAIGGALGTVTIGTVEVSLRALPLGALLDATWIVALTIAMRYCQDAVLVHRQYDYLHLLEENISPLVRGVAVDQPDHAGSASALHPDIYHREGAVYLSKYPLVLNVVWIAYVFIFPIIVIVATAWLTYLVWTDLPYPLPHRILDTVIALAIVALFLFYRVIPEVSSKWTRFQAWRVGRRAHKKRGATPIDRTAT